MPSTFSNSTLFPVYLSANTPQNTLFNSTKISLKGKLPFTTCRHNHCSVTMLIDEYSWLHCLNYFADDI